MSSASLGTEAETCSNPGVVTFDEYYPARPVIAGSRLTYGKHHALQLMAWNQGHLR